MQNHNKNNATLEEANNKIILLTLELEAISDKLNIREKLLLANNKERGELNRQLVNVLRELEQANVKLKEMDKRKSAFVANVSHEFKNPLLVIKESLSLIIEGFAEDVDSEQKDILSGAKRNTERLIRLVTNLLDVSKIEAGKVEMHIENFDIAILLNEILDNYKKELAKKDISLKKDIQKDIGAIWADRDKISQIVINLFNNAIKYTHVGGEVGIKLITKENELYFEISDTGPGIPKEYKDKIFDKFERITAEKIEGTGLGLPIAKDIVMLHKGRIWLESEAGKGSRFIFVLPRDLRDKNRLGQKI